MFKIRYSDFERDEVVSGDELAAVVVEICNDTDGAFPTVSLTANEVGGFMAAVENIDRTKI